MSPTIKSFEERNPHLQPLNEQWKLHYKAIVFFVNGIVHDDLEAQDIATSVFEKLIHLDISFEHQNLLKAFLYVSAKNLSLDYLREKKIHTRIHNDIAGQAEMFAEMHSGNNYDMMYAEYVQTLHIEIRNLPPMCKEVFYKIFFEHKSTDKIAQELRINVQTVRNHKTKAISLLKTAMLKKDLQIGILFYHLIIMNNQPN